MRTHQYRQSYSDEQEDEDDPYTSIPRSTIRYDPRQGSAIYYGPPPVKRKSRYTTSQPAPAQAGLRGRWLVYAGVGLMICIIGWLAITIIGAFWQSKVDDWTYGMPRTYQTDAVVGHSDSASNPSHFIAQNLKGEIVVIEYPGGNVSKARSYVITSLPGDDGYSPVRLAFKDLTGNGRLDMLVQIGDPGSQVQVILYNNGQQFAAKS